MPVQMRGKTALGAAIGALLTGVLVGRRNLALHKKVTALFLGTVACATAFSYKTPKGALRDRLQKLSRDKAVYVAVWRGLSINVPKATLAAKALEDLDSGSNLTQAGQRLAALEQGPLPSWNTVRPLFAKEEETLSETLDRFGIQLPKFNTMEKLTAWASAMKDEPNSPIVLSDLMEENYPFNVARSDLALVLHEAFGHLFQGGRLWHPRKNIIQPTGLVPVTRSEEEKIQAVRELLEDLEALDPKSDDLVREASKIFGRIWLYRLSAQYPKMRSFHFPTLPPGTSVNDNDVKLTFQYGENSSETKTISSVIMSFGARFSQRIAQRRAPTEGSERKEGS